MVAERFRLLTPRFRVETRRRTREKYLRREK
jgi:hypothetical protein